MKKFVIGLLAWWISSTTIAQQSNTSRASYPEKMISMYVHQHWSYNHPYAARTWTLDDWKGYLEGLSILGYNTVFIWAVMETMPLPTTPSDQAFIGKMVSVIDFAHSIGMRVFFPICPNVTVKDNAESQKYTYESRPFFYTDERVNPRDPSALAAFMKRTEILYRPLLEKADGITIIDSDPGGWPNSTYLDFVYLMGQYRQLLDRIKEGIELYYWAHAGWEAYGRFYATGHFEVDKPAVFQEVISLIAKQNYEPWGVGSSIHNVNELLKPLHLLDRGLAINYGAIEGEPTFPFTTYEVAEGRAYRGGTRGARRGVFGNAQTHCVQLPNTFAFARGAQGLPAMRSDYIAFANDLIVGKGTEIVEGWESLKSNNPEKIQQAIRKLRKIDTSQLKLGRLRGLLFGDGKRFLSDLVDQLKVAYTLQQFINCVNEQKADKQKLKKSLAAFIVEIENWQLKHGYSNQWNWPNMTEAFRKLNSPELNEALDSLTPVYHEGDTAFERIKKGYAQLERYSPRLIQAMKTALQQMQ